MFEITGDTDIKYVLVVGVKLPEVPARTWLFRLARPEVLENEMASMNQPTMSPEVV